jgi:hypothetical protein
VLSLVAPDVEILEHAARDARVIVAADTDFGALLANRACSYVRFKAPSTFAAHLSGRVARTAIRRVWG